MSKRANRMPTHRRNEGGANPIHKDQLSIHPFIHLFIYGEDSQTLDLKLGRHQ